MFFRFRSRFRRWLIAWAVLRIVCAATPVAAAVESSFAATGTPFPQGGTLDGMAFVLPEQPSADAIEASLALIGYFGRVNGISVLRAEIVPASQVGRMADQNPIVIGDAESNRLVTAWERHQSVRRDGNRVEAVTAGSVLARLLDAPDARTVALEGRGRTLARASVGAPQAWLAAFVSPLDAQRLLVVLGIRGGARLSNVTSDIADPATRPVVRETRPAPPADRWYAVPLGLLLLVAGFGLTLFVAVGLHRGLLFALTLVRTADQRLAPSHCANPARAREAEKPASPKIEKPALRLAS